MAPSKKALAAGTGLLVLIGLVTVISLKQVDQNEYGLVFNWITKQIGAEVYHGGLHLVGFWNTFVTFPATIRTIEFSERRGARTAGSLHTRTKEGLALHLSISFQYRLHPEALPKLYALTNLQYESLFVRIARDQLLEAASDYEGPQYWLERRAIGDKMRLCVDSQMQGSHASLWDLQLLRIDLPDQYEDSITKTQVQQQVIKTKQNEQLAAGIRANTEILQASFERKIRVVQAGATANYSLVTKLAEARAAQRRISAEADALQYVRKRLELSMIGAIEYQQFGAYEALQNATLLANVASATPIISAGAVAGKGALPGLLQMTSKVSSAKHATADRSDSGDSANTTSEPVPGVGQKRLRRRRLPQAAFSTASSLH